MNSFVTTENCLLRAMVDSRLEVEVQLAERGGLFAALARPEDDVFRLPDAATAGRLMNDR
jgi:hypothetical protein